MKKIIINNRKGGADAPPIFNKVPFNYDILQKSKSDLYDILFRYFIGLWVIIHLKQLNPFEVISISLILASADSPFSSIQHTHQYFQVKFL